MLVDTLKRRHSRTDGCFPTERCIHSSECEVEELIHRSLLRNRCFVCNEEVHCVDCLFYSAAPSFGMIPEKGILLHDFIAVPLYHVNKTKEHNFTSIPRIRAISQTIIQSITHFDPASPTHCIENRMRELSLFFCSYASLQTRVLPAYSQEVHRFVTEERRKVRYANCQESLRCRELPRCKSSSVHLGELPPSRLLPMHRKRGIRV